MTQPKKADSAKVVNLIQVAQETESDSAARHDDGFNDRSSSFNDVILSLNDSEAVTFRQIAEWVGAKSNTVSARYFPRVSQAHENLKAPALSNSSGKPTGYAAKAIAEYLQMNKDFDAYRQVLEQRFGGAKAEAPAQVVEVAIAPYQPDETALILEDSLGWHEDARLQAISKAAMRIQEYNAQAAEIKKSEDKEVFEEAFTEEVQRLEDEARRKLVAEQARLKARQFFRQIGDGTD